jgi:hypothetical protein
VTYLRVEGIDTIQIRLSARADFTKVAGIQFSWNFANPSADKYNRSTKLLLSFLVAYMLVLYAFYLKFDSESFTQVYLLVLGITGVFASNPINYFFPSVPGANVSDHILLAIFIAIYRMFLILELEMLRSHSTRPKTVLVAVLAIIFAFYATVDAAAGYDRQTHIANSEIETATVLQTEIARACLHSVYSIIALVYLIIAGVSNDGLNTRRLFFFGFSVISTVFVTLLSDVCLLFTNVWMYSVKPSLLATSIMTTLAALTLFLLHTGGGPEYVGLDKVKESDHQIIEIDQISEDGADAAAGDADDDEEDDGEEEEE